MRPGLNVLANYGPVTRNAHDSMPLKLNGKVYPRGFYCHAPSKILVRLAGPGQKFTALVGVNSNYMTQPGRGSIICSVSVAGKTVFRSGVLREGLPAASIGVNLNGAEEFVLEVNDAGDGISCDQAAWVDAQVTLAKGQTVWLGDMPLSWATRPGFTTEPPFSFTYGGQPSGRLLKDWPVERRVQKLNDQKTKHTLTYRDSRTGLVVRCEGLAYHDFPAIEWTVFFQNGGTVDTPILADIQALDTRLERHPYGEFLLHHHKGDDCSPSSYQPVQTRLEPKSVHRLASVGGRPTTGSFPYFNVEFPEQGLLVALGWPGQWAARFERDPAAGLRLVAGQELTRFKLLPGEEIRTPLVVAMFWNGDRFRAHNTWRRWMLAHNSPRPGGQLPPPFLSSCSGGFFPGLQCNEKDEFRFIDTYLKQGIKLDYWWMDAGWYPCGEAGWPKVGTWEPDPQRFPRGLKAVSDHAHAKGVKLIVWFEPERVAAGTWLAEKHPDWIFGGAKGGLLNLGHNEARKWLTDHVDGLLTGQGIDLYRQDFNIDPLGYWRANDAADRQGITEIKHVMGYLAFWDELRRRHPDLLIDSCASGGRRNDLETLRRAVPLLRSDYQSFAGDPSYAPGNQCHTYGLSFWLPYYGQGVYYNDEQLVYNVRSYMCPAFGMCWDVRKEGVAWGKFRRLTEEWRKIAPYYLGDFYPLSSYSLENDVWMVWQFDRPDLGEGVVQAFRRKE
jgi:alpha-galactosidase